MLNFTLHEPPNDQFRLVSENRAIIRIRDPLMTTALMQLILPVSSVMAGECL